VMYVAKAGDRWDLIAHRTLGDAKKVGKLLKHNPALLVLEFVGGEKVTIPEEKEEAPREVERPPWL